MAASSKSHTVLPSTTDPARDSTPEATRRLSTRVVLPAPDGPTSTTLRTAAGLSAAGADRAAWEVFVLSAMTCPSCPSTIHPMAPQAQGGGGIQVAGADIRVGSSRPRNTSDE